MGISSCHQNFCFTVKENFQANKKSTISKKNDKNDNVNGGDIWFTARSSHIHAQSPSACLYLSLSFSVCVRLCQHLKIKNSVANVHSGKWKCAFFVGQGVGRRVKFFILLTTIFRSANCYFHNCSIYSRFFFINLKKKKKKTNRIMKIIFFSFFSRSLSFSLYRSSNLLSHFNYSAGWNALVVTFPSILI